MTTRRSNRINALIALAFFPAMICLSARARAEQAMESVPAVGPHGQVMETRAEVGPAKASEPAEARLQSRDMQLLWSRYLPDPIYTTTGISTASSTVLAGNYLNPPKEAEAIPLEGDGTPSWVHPGTEFYVDAARDADVLAGLDCTSTDSTVTVMEWRAASSTPLWTYQIQSCRPLTGEGWSSGKGIQVSDDGSTIAAIANVYGAGGLDVRLIIFDAGSGSPAVVHQFADGTASALAITPDGAYVAIYAWPFIYVYDRYSDTVRWSGAAGSGNDALAISPDGNYVAWGWNVLNLRQWSGSTYQGLWTTTKAGYYVTECAFSPDSRLAVAWYRSSFDDSIVELFTLPAHLLIWDYSYTEDLPELPHGGAAGGGASDARDRGLLPTDVISELVFSPTGAHLAAASWGPQFAEVHLWQASDPVPAGILDTPGTMFDIDVVSLSADAAVATACGKHVHAGTSGRGADLYAIGAGVTGVGSSGTLGPGREPHASLYPNPAAGAVTIDWSALPSPPDRLSIFDLQGRLVSSPSTLPQRNGTSVVWNGYDASGRPAAPGVYLVRLEVGARATSSRLVIIK